MRFTQKKLSTLIEFAFDDEELHYRVKDNSGDRKMAIAYASIPPDKRIVHERNVWWRNVGALWCILGVVQVGLALSSARLTTWSVFWLVLGLGCLAVYYIASSSYTVIDTEQGSIWVMFGAQHDVILSKIDERRKSDLLAWYRNTDFGDDAEREIQAVKWLVRQEAMTRQESEKRIASLRAAPSLLALSSETKPN